MRFVLAAAGLLCCCRAQAADTHGILVLEEWGVYSATADRRVTDPNATTGHATMSRDVHLLERTHHICAQLGTHFGIRYHLRDDFPANSLAVAVDVQHPPMVNTRGAMQSHDEMIRQVPAHSSTYTGWIFAEPRELVGGVWHIVVRHGGDTEIDEKFDVRTACAPPVS